jgi:hypothetical protein
MNRTARFVMLALATQVALAGTAVGARASEPATPGTSSSDALQIARTSQPGWRLGRLMAREHDRRRSVEAELLSGGTAIAWLRIDPVTGRLLPRGDRAARGAAPIDPERLRPQVEAALGRLEIGTWAWPAEHGRAWAVPLRWEGRVVGAIKIDVRRARLLAAEHDDDEDED